MSRPRKALTAAGMLSVAALCVPASSLAQSDALFVDQVGNVGVGTNAPGQPLHVVREDGAQILVENTSGVAQERVPFRLVNNGKTRFAIVNNGNGWTFDNDADGAQFNISRVGTGANEFVVQANGDTVARGIAFAQSHQNTSTRSVKEDFAPISGERLLSELAKLDILKWRYKTENESTRHIGPVAEDFQAAFGLGDGKHISTVDANGIALATIKELHSQLSAERQKVSRMQERYEILSQRIDALESRQQEHDSIASLQ